MPSVFGCTPSRSRCGNVPNELVHRAGLPFLNNHYSDCGYQHCCLRLNNIGSTLIWQIARIVCFVDLVLLMNDQ